MSDDGKLAKVASIFEEKDAEKRNGSGFTGSATRTVAILGFAVVATVGIGSWLMGQAEHTWATWPFAAAFIFSLLALPIAGAASGLVKRGSFDKIMGHATDLVEKLRS